MRVAEIVELLGSNQQALVCNVPNEEEDAWAEINAVRAELLNLDRRTHEISLIGSELAEEQQAISESILSMRRQQKRGLRGAPKRALRDITRAFNKRAKAQASLARRRAAPVKRTAAPRTQPQAAAKPIAQATTQCPPPVQKVVYLMPAHSQPVPQVPATTAVLRQHPSAPLPAQRRPAPMPQIKQATAPIPPTLPTRPMPSMPPSKPLPPAPAVVFRAKRAEHAAEAEQAGYQAMIINILDLRADHQAVNPIDAAVMGFDQETDKNGVLRAVLNWQHRRIRRDVDISTAISWAQSKTEPAILMLFDAESTRSELADERMSMTLAKQLALSELGLLVPIGELPIVEEDNIAAKATEASAVQGT